MELALIPPVSRLNDTLSTYYQLVLPHMWVANEEYREWYKSLIGYKILDNGAAEGREIAPDEYVSVIHEVNPDEFALPDVLGDADATFRKATNFLGDYYHYVNEFKTGYVAQGKSIDEVYKSILKAHEALPEVDVIYIPRLLIRESGKYNARIRLMTEYDLPDSFEYHFFGASPYWVEEIKYAARLTNVRSFDTSMPYNYANLGFDMAKSSMHAITRPNNYFDLQLDGDKKYYADTNVATILRWANGK